MLKIKAIKIKQWGTSEEVKPTAVYLTAMRLEEFTKRYQMDRWTDVNREGYQREISEARLGTGKTSIVRYLFHQLGTFPTSVLVNIRGKTEFNSQFKVDGNIEMGELIIYEDVFWLIDGQHRVEALKVAVREKEEFKNYPLIVSFIVLSNRFDEMMHFYIVNSRQKSVPTDLAVRLLQSMVDKVVKESGRSWILDMLSLSDLRKGLAASIIDYLTEEERSPWYKKIQCLGEEWKPCHIIKDNSMVRFIAPLLREKMFEAMDDERIASLLIDYWQAIRELYPLAFGNIDEYTLCQTPGIASFHMLFSSIYAMAAREGKVSKDKMKEMLGVLQAPTEEHPDSDFKGPIGDNWWSKKSGPAISRGTSQKIFTEISKGFAEKIKLARAT
jgi:DGQHR domain-containing protein